MAHSFLKIALLAPLTLADLGSCSADPKTEDARQSEPVLAGHQPIYRDIDDWLLVCSNLRDCTVRSVKDELAFAGKLTITRGAGPSGRLQVSIARIGPQEDLDLRDFTLDDQPMAMGFDWRRQAGTAIASLDHDDAWQFIKAIGFGQKLSFGRGDLRSSISLHGFVHAIAGMDEAQGRSGTVTALIRTGGLPVSAVPMAPEAPVLYAAPLQALSEQNKQFVAGVREAQSELLKREECKADPAQRMDVAYALDDQTNLVILGCYLGLYQLLDLVFVAPKTNPKMAEVLSLPPGPVRSGDCTQTGGRFMEAQWDAKSSTLSVDERARGPGDCGESLSWTYLGQGQWALSEQRAMLRCGGGFADWPQVYKAHVLRRKTPANRR